ncbi:MAG: hypothetical protein ACT4QC_07250 [Planctomycetaceae bacterium]
MNVRLFEMSPACKYTCVCTLLLFAYFAVPAAAQAGSTTFAYIGPGPALGLIGSLIAVLFVFVLGLLGLILYPLRLLFRSRRGEGVNSAAPEPTAAAPGGAPATTAVLPTGSAKS